ncbi:MAG TPA: AAA family ATPase, partial [Candidatus Angelobacter sp.]
ILMAIERLTIEGFKSIRKLEDFELRPLNVLIGANGAGKSNLVGFFRLLRALIDQKLNEIIGTEGGADACLYLGPKVTKQLGAKISFDYNQYEFVLRPTADNRFVFGQEEVVYAGGWHSRRSLGSGHVESPLKDLKEERGSTAEHGYYVYNAISRWVVYHFHDTSSTAGVRRQRAVNDDEYLRPDAENLAAFLYGLQHTHPAIYQQIRDVVRLAAPFFDDFKLRPITTIPDLIQLDWLQKDSDYFFRPSQLSDGTLRFICLATALLQPSPPSTVLFDEPELGLHPYALTLLASLIRQAATRTQVIVATQSAPLLDEFVPEDVIVVERAQGESTFRRLKSEDLSEWRQEYALGELWQKNVLGGRPQREDAPQPSNMAPSGNDHT